jgi:hypothetical protein
MGYQCYKAWLDGDSSIGFRGWVIRALADGGSAWRPATVANRAVVRHIRPGETFEGEGFAYWRALLEKSQRGAATVEMITVHEHLPCFPCRGDCPQHPADDYETMSRVVEQWSSCSGSVNGRDAATVGFDRSRRVLDVLSSVRGL